MGEAALFSLASKILSTIASPAFDKAYERARSIYGARRELDDLKNTIRSIQAVLADAEKRQEGSVAVKNWMERLRDVLYDADDLFDEVATIDLLKQQVKGIELLKKVRIFSSKLNPLASNYLIAKKVKAVRKTLNKISVDMDSLGFVKCVDDENPISMRREVVGPVVDPNKVIGREYEKEVVLKFLFDESKGKESISVLAIVGIGGMGKSTLAQLIYNDNEVEIKFRTRWWAYISDIVDEKEVLEKICQSMGVKDAQNLDATMLQYEISSKVRCTGKYLIVLDDVWDRATSSPSLWLNVMSLLEYGAQGSKIVVTTRSLIVPRLMVKAKAETLELGGLSENKSWELFKTIAFTEEQEKDQEWTSLGRTILHKCRNVPLAIKSIATVLRRKTTKEEWASIKNEKLLNDGTIMSALKLSYHHLPSYLKPCFAYCSLIPKDDLINKDELVYLWIAQGYVTPKNGETYKVAGHCYFMDLLNCSFFQMHTVRSYGDGIFYTMHDLVHDLAEIVAGGETGMILHSKIRHLRLMPRVFNGSNITSLSADRLRSFIVMETSFHSWLFHETAFSPKIVDKIMKFKQLRALCLKHQNIKNVPSSIGKLPHLRHLDISDNDFRELPNSITKLVNLITLDINRCCRLKMLPDDVNKLVNLSHLNNENCYGLTHMPTSLVELTQLQSLSYFIVGKAVGGGKSCRLHELGKLNISGKVEITFFDDEDGDEYWQVPTTITDLMIRKYQGIGRTPRWGADKPINLVSLIVCDSDMKYLPPLHCFPCLKNLTLDQLYQLEYVDQTEVSSRLKVLNLLTLPKLIGWSREVELTDTTPYPQMVASFPVLEHHRIVYCTELLSMPLCPQLETLELTSVKAELMLQLLLACSKSLKSLIIKECKWLKTFSSEALTSLRCLKLIECYGLEKLNLSQHNKIEELWIHHCHRLGLWGVFNKGVDWDSLHSLQKLILYKMPIEDQLPECLQQRLALGKLEIREYNYGAIYSLFAHMRRPWLIGNSRV